MSAQIAGASVFHVDCFTSVPLTGNPAAVVVLPEPVDDTLGRRIGVELNQPATAVVWPLAQAGHFGLRWFTATTELMFCGHGTLAAARVLLDAGLAPHGELRFETAAGELAARASNSLVELDFPCLPPTPVGDVEIVTAVERVLGFMPSALLRNELDLLAVLPSASEVRAATPDLAALLKIDTRGLIITAVGGRGDADFVSRFFSPAMGIPEDSVTGSAHCTLGPYWIERLGRQPLLGQQVSARGGFVRVTVQGERALLAGESVVISEGRWNLAQ